MTIFSEYMNVSFFRTAADDGVVVVGVMRRDRAAVSCNVGGAPKPMAIPVPVPVAEEDG